MSIPIRVIKIAILAVAFVLGGKLAAFAQADTNATTIAYWKFDQWSTNIPAGATFTNGFADLATNVGQGTLTGTATAPAAVDDLYVSGPLAADIQLVNDAPPDSMFNSGYGSGGTSWNSAHGLTDSGQVLYPVDQFGNEFAGPSFTEEVFFKSTGPSGVKQTLIWNHQSSAYAHLQVDEDGNTGDLTFWGWDGQNYQAVRIANGSGRFDDGNWHCAVGRYDAGSKIMSLMAINQDGSAYSNSIALSQNLNPGGPGDLYIGNDESASTRFNGEINQVRMSSIALPNSKLLAAPGSAQAHTVAYWQMNGMVTDLAENQINGDGILDLATNAGQGVLNGTASNNMVAPSVDNLFVTGPTLPGDIAFIPSVPPTSMFNTNYAYTAGTNSWDAGANLYDEGEVYFPEDVYGDELSTPSFTEEVFFKSDAESTDKQTLLSNHAHSAYAELQINESADTDTNDIGSLLFWAWNVQTFPTVRITAAQNGGQRFDDGNWHYAAIRFDASTLTMSLLVVNQDGSTFAASEVLTEALNPGGEAGDTFIGNDETASTPYDGEINQVRMSDVALPNQELLAAVPECIAPYVLALSQSVTNYIGDVTYFAVTPGGLNPLLQWQFNGTNLVGQTNSLLQIFPTESTNAGNYDVVLSTTCGLAVTSAPISLTVIPTIRPVVNIARWSMEAQIEAPNNNGAPSFVGIADSDTNAGQGVFTTGTLPASIDDLIDFNTLVLTNDVPPPSMFINGNNAGTNSYVAASLEGSTGAMFFPQDQYGDEFDFQTAFSVELFFKTLGDQSATGKMELIAQGSDLGGSGTGLRYGADVNDVAPGAVTFTVVSGGDAQIVSLTNQNYADGTWHYLLAQYDSSSSKINLAVVNQNGAASAGTTALPAGFGPLPQNNTGNMFIGRYNYAYNPPSDDPRNFNGMIDEVQISSGLVSSSSGQLGFVPTVVTPHITGLSISGGVVTIAFTGSPSDNASAFALVGSSMVNGTFAVLNSATITSLGSGNFRATVATSGSTEFYRIRR